MVGRRGDQKQRESVRQLFFDESPLVRLRAAQGLLGAGDPAGVPILVDLLKQTDAAIALQAEELLCWLASESAPEAPWLAQADASHDKCYQAWRNWTKKQGDTIDLSKIRLACRKPGLFLLCDEGANNDRGRLWLVGCNGRTRWQASTVAHPKMAVWTKANRIVVIAEIIKDAKGPNDTGRPKLAAGLTVSEQQLDGTIVWKYDGLTSPFTITRLPNGTWFIGGKDLEVAEIGADGTAYEKKTLSLPERYKTFCQPIVCAPGTYLCLGRDDDKFQGFLDWPGNQDDDVNAVLFSDKPLCDRHFRLELLSPNHYLLAGVNSGQVHELWSTMRVWHWRAIGASHALRLPTGHFLIASRERLVEIADVAKADGAKPPRKAKAKKEAMPKKTSCLDAAAKVLAEEGRPMTCQEMIEAMAAKGYWTSPGGKTPSATLYSAILRELTPMTEAEWLACTDPSKLVAYLRVAGNGRANRRLRLLARFALGLSEPEEGLG